MSLTLHFHPLASFCHKVLIALDELGLAFTPVIVDLMAEAAQRRHQMLLERKPRVVRPDRYPHRMEL